jgi:polysaccharide export outer membrane protein
MNRTLSSLVTALVLGTIAVPSQIAAQTFASSTAPSGTIPFKSQPFPPLSKTPMADYYLGVGDAIDIKVFGYDEYTGMQSILPDGTITLPLVGKINAVDRTTEQLTKEVTARLKRYLTNPVVTISITKQRPIRVVVTGEVQRPGVIQLQSLEPVANQASSSAASSTPTLSEAIEQAGGITRKADLRQITLKRRTPTGEPTEIQIDLWQALRSGTNLDDPLLQDGDSIYVPLLSANADIDSRLAARTSFSAKTVRVRVVGEVKQPGEVQVSPDSSLSSAIAIAGGPTEKANMDKVVFVRLGDDGQIERRELDLKNLTDNYQVQEGDVLMVPKSTASGALDAGSQLLGPLGFFLRLFGL